jgi:hypothetical protein
MAAADRCGFEGPFLWVGIVSEHDRGLGFIAEGVETAGSLAQLTAFGCEKV